MMNDQEALAQDDQDVEVRCHARVSAGRSPSERSLHSCTLLNVEGCRVVYLYGGRNKNGIALDDLHVLDLEANYWRAEKPKGEKPAGRFGHVAQAFESNLYVFGGHSRGQATFNFGGQPEGRSSGMFSDKKKGQREADTEATDQLQRYDTEKQMWSEVEVLGDDRPSARYKHASCFVPERRGEARVFIFGGQDEDGIALNDEHFLNLKPGDEAPSWCALVGLGVSCRAAACFGRGCMAGEGGGERMR